MEDYILTLNGSRMWRGIFDKKFHKIYGFRNDPMAIKHGELDKKDVSSVPEMGKPYKNFRESDGKRECQRACSRLEKRINPFVTSGTYKSRWSRKG
jgi:hypothetical protein